jgi:hypothetical protein
MCSRLFGANERIARRPRAILRLPLWLEDVAGSRILEQDENDSAMKPIRHPGATRKIALDKLTPEEDEYENDSKTKSQSFSSSVDDGFAVSSNGRRFGFTSEAFDAL